MRKCNQKDDDGLTSTGGDAAVSGELMWTLIVERHEWGGTTAA